MIKAIDSFLNRITMYRLTLYYLIGLVGAAMLLSALGYLSYNPLMIAVIAGYMCLLCWITNQVFARVYEAPTNFESSFITALILALIITPTVNQQNLVFLTAAGGLAISSKYILAINKKHVFNPAAVAVALTALGAGQAASWWIGSLPLLPFVLVGGVLLVRKIRRSHLVITFLASVTLATIIYGLLGHSNIAPTLQKTAFHSSLFFLAFVMLTEPLTSPPTESKQRWYAGLAGALFPPQVHILSLYTTPELTLIVSNAFAYLISPKIKLFPRLVQKITLTPDTKDFVFATNQRLTFKPGQYMEWTLPHHQRDNRGDRRYFTFASSPTEENIRLGVKFYDQGSSFKKALLAMDSSSLIAASQLGGDFVMPDDPTKKLVFIAGGIGVTPFRSMIKYLIDTNTTRPITLLYSEKNAGELVYTDVFETARKQLGIKTIYTLTDSGVPSPAWARSGNITAELIKAEVPNYLESLFYISGPHMMVTAMEHMLQGMGIKKSHIKIDYFPGYA